jgi:hypothetical protein
MVSSSASSYALQDGDTLSKLRVWRAVPCNALALAFTLRLHSRFLRLLLQRTRSQRWKSERFGTSRFVNSRALLLTVIRTIPAPSSGQNRK